MDHRTLKTESLLAVIGALLCCALSRALAAEAEEERWNAYGQATYISQWKDAFPAAYTNLNGTPNSLLPQRERSWSATATAYLGRKLWQGGEIYFVPEMIAQVAFSNLRGIGGSVQNGELEKTGFSTPIFYVSRLFLRQTWNLGGEPLELESAPMQLAKSVDSRRFVVTAGNIAIIDIFDRNAYAGDIRQQFLSMNFATYTAWDFAADARGYSWGLVGEYFHDEWAVRAGRFLVPQLPNQLERWFHSAEALENPPLLDRRERDLGGSRRSLNPQARCGSAWTKLDDGRHGEHSPLKERWRGA